MMTRWMRVFGVAALCVLLVACKEDRPAPKLKQQEAWAGVQASPTTKPSTLPSSWPKPSASPSATATPTSSPAASPTPTASPSTLPSVSPTPSPSPTVVGPPEAYRCQLARTTCTSGTTYGFWLIETDPAAAAGACRLEAQVRRETFCQVNPAQPIPGAAPKAINYVCELSESCRDNPKAENRYEEMVTASDYRAGHVACIQKAIQLKEEFCQITAVTVPPILVDAPTGVEAFRCQLATIGCHDQGGRYGYWVSAKNKRKAKRECKREAKDRGEKLCTLQEAYPPQKMPKGTPKEFDCEISKKHYTCRDTLAGSTGRDVIAVASSDVGEAHLKCMVAAANAKGEFCRMVGAR
ncbi:MAG: hypothetical protein JNL01_06345 [Bdellovibrionales bacterium]|nr:hypothetical protein [Bdellovibrionales bacterium]